MTSATNSKNRLRNLILLLCLAALPVIFVKDSPLIFAASVGNKPVKFNGKIVFVSTRHSSRGLSIWTMNADGSSPIRLTDERSRTDRLPAFVQVYDSEPVWSPDGTRIAFVSNRDVSFAIYIMNADGSNARLLTDKAQDPGAIAWSPDGNRIAFSAGSRAVLAMQGAHPNIQLYTVNTDGSELAKLTTEGYRNDGPSWSPDGKQIRFVSDRDQEGELSIWSMNADGTNQTRLGDLGKMTVGFPAWSPDGRRLLFAAYHGTSQILVMNADGTDKRVIATAMRRGMFERPKWSPDGTRILTTLRSPREPGDPDDQVTAIVIMNADGSNQITLSNRTDRRFVDASPDWQPLAAPPVTSSSIIGFASDSYQADKSSESVTLKVTRTGNLNDEAFCSYTRHTGGTPDIKIADGRLRFAPGESSKTISLSLAYSDRTLSNYSFKVTLSDNEGNGTFVGGIQVTTVHW